MSLRISLVGERVRSDGNRVRYAFGERAVTPEALVLRRWKARTGVARDGKRVVFDGCRLPPHTWDVLNACVDGGCALDSSLTTEVLQRAVECVRGLNPRWRAPQTDKFGALIAFLQSRRKLEVVRNRLRTAATPGVPDLFLFRRDADGRVHGGRFVEVKRRWRTDTTSVRERVRPDQRAEIDFLRAIGLKAMVVYIIEAGPGAFGTAPDTERAARNE